MAKRDIPKVKSEFDPCTSREELDDCLRTILSRAEVTPRDRAVVLGALADEYATLVDHPDAEAIDD